MYHYFNACACALCGILLSACPRLASHNSENTHQNENRFLAFGSLTSNAEVEKCNDFCLYHKVEYNCCVSFFCSVYF